MMPVLKGIRQQILRENRFTKYFLYVLGETALIILGILLALQIDSAYNNRKNIKVARGYMKALIEDMRQDIQETNDLIEVVSIELNKIRETDRRIKSPAFPYDSLLQIARYEFSPGVDVENIFNRATYNTLAVTGDFKIIPEKVRDMIVLHHTNQDLVKGHIQTAKEIYSDILTLYYRKYPINSDSDNGESGNGIYDYVWRNIDKNTFIPEFLSLMKAKERFLELVLKNKAQILRISEQTIKVLEDELK